jgi:hypothetical protein
MSFGVFVDPHLPYCVWKFEIKDTTATGRSASNIDLHLEIDSEGWLRTKLYDKRDDYNFPIAVTVNQVMVATVKLSKWLLQLNQKEHLMQ